MIRYAQPIAMGGAGDKLRAGLRILGSSHRALAIGIVSMTVLSAPALAQDQANNVQATTAAPTKLADEIVVTGSRISRNDYKSESPISTISSAAITAAGQPSLDRAIGQMPQFEAAQGSAEVGDVQGSVGFGGGASYSDLRGIGRNRSLVLMDGRRLMPSTPDGSIDLNTIPMSMIDSAEVITGGASAAYGSDAVAGVANFKLRQHFSGVEMGVQEGITGHGDGATTQVYALAGGSFDEGRGHVMLDVEYSKRDAISGSQRSFFTQPSVRFLGRPPEGVIYAGGFGAGATAPSIAAVNGVLAGYPGTTPIAGTGAYPGAIGVNTNGTIFTSAAGANCAQNYKGVGSVTGAILTPDCTTAGVVLGNYFAVQLPLTKYNVFSKADYEFNDHITGYTQFNFSESKSLDQTSPGSTKTNNGPIELVVPVSNPFVQSNPALLSLINSAYGGAAPANANVYLSKLMYGWGNRVQNFKYDVWQALAGLKGDIPGTKLQWDVYGSIGKSNYTSVATGDISLSAINNVLATETATSGPGGCVWNPLGYQSVSKACLSYAGRTDVTTDEMTSKNVEATIQGPLFNLPAGSVKFAAGADYRYSNYSYQPATEFVTSDTLSYGSDTASAGSQNTKEVFGELLVPLLKDKPFAQDVSLDLGYRYSKYNTFSGKSTWKADLSWTLADQLRLRGGYSRAIRAPSLADLYVGNSISDIAIGGGDPCNYNSAYRTGANGAKVQSLCAAQSAGAGGATYSGSPTVPVQSGGNSLLQPETANTWTLGAVITPLHGLNISVDYYHVKIAGAISSLSTGEIIADCYGATGNPGFSAGNPYCQRIQRDPNSGNIQLLTSGLFNYNSMLLDGIDTQIDYQFRLDQIGLPATAGNLHVGTIVSYLGRYTVTDGLGNVTRYAGAISDTLVTADGENLYAHPRWKANSFVTYNNGPFTGTLRWRYIGGMANLDAPGSSVPSVSYFDLDAHYTFDKRITISAGVNNLGDKSPPFIGTLELRTDAATYDVVGRSFYMAAKVKF
ncbi:MAG: TonB-dependent receptor [Sphingomonadales bacterium]|nr:TonB-dependent receptor [Sphingomonadales bacterium]MDE2171571.1 TonB-dependent receptor [Sphingomonadales bacterium]